MIAAQQLSESQYVRAFCEGRKLGGVRRRSIFQTKSLSNFHIITQIHSSRILHKPGRKFWHRSSQCDDIEFMERASKTLAELYSITRVWRAYLNTTVRPVFVTGKK